MAFHHGTETKRTDGGSSPVYDIDGAITALVGTAPMGAVNDLIVCQTVKDFAQFSASPLTVASGAQIYCDQPYTMNAGITPDKRISLLVTVPWHTWASN